jgi:hypothetical protein
MPGAVLALFGSLSLAAMGAVPVSALTYTGPPLETTCKNSSGNGPVPAGGSVTCAITSDLSISQGNPFTVSPVLPSGATITGCATTNPNIVATPPGGKLPLYLNPSRSTLTAQTAVDTSTTAPANTCAYTWIPTFFGQSEAVVGTETFTVRSRIGCGSEITRQKAAQWITNGAESIDQAGHLVTFSDVGFSGIVSGGYLRCGESVSSPVVDTGIPAQTTCTTAGGAVRPGGSAACTVISNLFLPTGGTVVISPLFPRGATVTGCSSSRVGIVATGPGGTLPKATNQIFSFLPGGGTFVTFQAQIGASSTVPANSCAFTALGATNPAGIGGDTVFGTETLSVPRSADCGTELTQRTTNYIPNESGVINPVAFPTYFPQTLAATISGGFLCHSGNSTTLSRFTNTGLPVEGRCTQSDERREAGGSVDCSLTNNVFLFTGDTLFISPTAPRDATVTSCKTTTPGMVATRAGANLPTLSASSGIVTSAGLVQAAALDSNGNTITTVPGNTCAFTNVGGTPPGLPSGSVVGTDTVSIKGRDLAATDTTSDSRDRSDATELIQRADVYDNVGIPFGFGQLATGAPGSAGVPAEVVNDTFAGSAGSRIGRKDEEEQAPRIDDSVAGG